ncbi:MAG: DUF2493 domain-containing protein [Chloroflexi bacterium]|nr:DUF2493 domain-containing protein [Chloroflexota bacterium]
MRHAPVKRVLVCGSRNLSEKRRREVIDALEYLWRRNPLVIIHGAARGADSMASDWATERGCEQVEYPANWRQYGRKAGPIRNQQMLTEGKPDIVLAFPEKDSVGTWDMVERSKKAGLELLVQTGVGLARIDGDEGKAESIPHQDADHG